MLRLGPFGFDVLIEEEDGAGGGGGYGRVESGEGLVADWAGVFGDYYFMIHRLCGGVDLMALGSRDLCEAIKRGYEGRG